MPADDRVTVAMNRQPFIILDRIHGRIYLIRLKSISKSGKSKTETIMFVGKTATIWESSISVNL